MFQHLTKHIMYKVYSNNGISKSQRDPQQGRVVDLPERLQCLLTDVSHELLMVFPEWIAVFRDRSGRYGFFDSHSMTADGLPHPTGGGTAVILTFTHLSDMTDRIIQLF